MNLEVTYVATTDLIPYANNPRTHSDQQVAQVAASIQEFGFNNPILIDEHNGIIAGHGRLAAAQKLNMNLVPTILLEGLSEAQRKAYVIADNQIALNSNWNLSLLESELEFLLDSDFQLDNLGIDLDFLSGLPEAADYSEKNKEIDIDSFEDVMELKLKFSSEQYELVRKALIEVNSSCEIALLEILGL
tara:strand:+ start:244 stop:810 length:567 start_codon:yes stop_codon:yes gene_type:complete